MALLRVGNHYRIIYNKIWTIESILAHHASSHIIPCTDQEHLK